MADSTRTLLLSLLGVTFCVAVIAVAGSTAGRKIGELKTRIADYSQRVKRLETQEASPLRAEGTAPEGVGRDGPAVVEMRRTIELEQGRYYTPGETTASGFAEVIQAELLRAGLRVTRYRPVEDRSGDGLHSLAEFAVTGDAEAFLGFLRTGRRSSRYRYFSNISVHALGTAGAVEVAFRVGYEEVALDSSK